MKTTALKAMAVGFTFAASQAFAGSDSPFGELSRYNDAMGSGPVPQVVAFPEGGQTASFKVTPLAEIARYTDPVGSGASPAVSAQDDRGMAATEPRRNSRFWRFLSRNQRTLN